VELTTEAELHPARHVLQWMAGLQQHSTSRRRKAGEHVSMKRVVKLYYKVHTCPRIWCNNAVSERLSYNTHTLSTTFSNT